VSSDTALKVENLGKAYEIYKRPEDRLKQFLFRGRRQCYEEFWALRDISFDVGRGEMLGIVGRNGSGKSTLLSLIAGTLTPTTGSVTANGRVSALLELGTGFNMEFSGRENVLLNGAILGMSRSELEAAYEDVVDFAELQPYMDQPVRTYSTGMMVRLAFSVAIAVEPEILAIDEALGVGDEAFARKSFARVDEMRRRGCTVLLATHNSSLLAQACSRALLLDEGENLLLAQPKEVITQYHRLIFAPGESVASIREEIRAGDAGQEASVGEEDEGDTGAIHFETSALPATFTQETLHDSSLRPQSTTSYVSLGAQISVVHFEDKLGRTANILTMGQLYHYTYRVTFDQPAYCVRFGMLVKNVVGVDLGGQVTHSEGDGLDYVGAGQTVEVRFSFRNRLTAGVFFANAGVLGFVNGKESYLHRIIDACMFRVIQEPGLKITAMFDFSDPEVKTSVRTVQDDLEIAQSGPEN
jgi:lipopolysaccharide transport system ATP-binding protein